MKLVPILLLVVATCGCAVTMGANVKKFDVRGQSFIKCTIIVQKGDHKLANESLEVCKDAFGMEHPEAERH